MIRKKVRGLILTPACLVPFISALFYFVIFKGAREVQLLYGISKVFLLIWPLLGFWLLHESMSLKNLFKVDLRSGAVGIAFSLCVFLCMVILMHTSVGDIVRAGAATMKEKIQAMGIYHHYWAFALLISLVHSLLEEYYWRWFVYGQMQKIFTGFFPHLLAGIAFSAHHLVVTWQYFPPLWATLFAALVGVGGIVWSLLYQRTQSLIAPWISHVIVDLAIFWVGYQVVF